MAIKTPVKFQYSQLIAAGATFNPLTDWQYETPDVAVMVEVIDRATAVGLVVAITSGGETLQQECPVQAGGTAGTTPARLNSEPLTGHATAFQKVRVAYRNPTGGGITVDGLLTLTPSRGGGGGGGGRRRRVVSPRIAFIPRPRSAPRRR